MATCADIDNNLASLKASNEAKLAAMQLQIDQLRAEQQTCCSKVDGLASQLAQLILTQATFAASVGIQIATAVGNLSATLTGQIATIGAQVTQVLGLGSRTDALESGLDATNTGLSQAFTLIGVVRDNARKELKEESDRLTASLYALEAVFNGNLNRAVALLQKLIEECCKRIDDFINDPNNSMNQCCNEIKALIAAQTLAQGVAFAALQGSVAGVIASNALIGAGLIAQTAAQAAGFQAIQDNINNTRNTLLNGLAAAIATGNASQLTAIAAAIALLDRVIAALNVPINGVIGGDTCGETLQASYAGTGLPGIVNAMQAFSTVERRAIDVVCTEIKENMCSVLEPSDQYTERNIISQIMIRFVPKGTTKNFSTVSSWRLHIPNPRANITCDELKTLTWTRGKIVGNIFFNNGNISTGSYFNDLIEGEALLLKLAAFSTDALKYPKPRMTLNGSPKRTPIIVEVVPWYAVITTLVNGVVTSKKCIKCLP